MKTRTISSSPAHYSIISVSLSKLRWIIIKLNTAEDNLFQVQACLCEERPIQQVLSAIARCHCRASSPSISRPHWLQETSLRVAAEGTRSTTLKKSFRLLYLRPAWPLMCFAAAERNTRALIVPSPSCLFADYIVLMQTLKKQEVWWGRWLEPLLSCCWKTAMRTQ